MESKEPTPRTVGIMMHPDPTEWMEFLYDETSPGRKRDLATHLAQCPACASRLGEWQESMRALDKFELPPTLHSQRTWRFPIKIAAAAALMLLAGFTIGRKSSTSMAEIETLRSSVAQLALMVQERDSINYSNSVIAATAAASEETLRLLGDYSRSEDEKRLADRQALGLALSTFETRLAQVHRDLETVAVNTQTGFQETHQNMSQLVSYFPPQLPANPK